MPKKPLPRKHRPWLIELVCILGVLLVIAAVWLTATNRWSAAHWQVPLTYEEDPAKADVLWVLAGIKAAQEGHLGFFRRITIPELGAPFGARWDDFPWTEKWVFVVPGLLARWIGLFPALNFAVLLAHLLAGAGFYAAARGMNANRIWAIMGAIVFALSRYAWARGAHHLNVTLFWHVPLFLLVCRWILDGLPARGRRWWIALAVAVITGAQNIYYTYIFLQLAAFCVLVRWLRHGWREAWPGLLAGAAAVLSVVAMNMNTLLAWAQEGQNPGAVVRFYQWLEYYALKPADLFIPFSGHRLGDLGLHYLKQTLIVGEIPMSAYLGIVGIVGFVWLTLETFLRLARRPVTTPPMEAAMIGWIFLYSVVGGINGLLGALGIQLFRATTRFSIVILALVLLFLARRLTSLLAGRPLVAAGVAAVAIVVAIFDQTTAFTTDEEIQKIAGVVDSDRRFVQQLEERLPENAMIFQLPIIDFPERIEGAMPGYDHFRPYLFSEDLRFSFGTVKGRTRQDWHNDLKTADLPEAIEMLERYGFAAVLVNLKGFPGKGQEIATAFGHIRPGGGLQSDTRELLALFLQPSPQPELPERKPSPTLERAGN